MRLDTLKPVKMKFTFLLFATLITVLSCNRTETPDPEFDSANFPQKWQLVSMQGNVAKIAPQTGADMSWQEVYIFSSDGNLTKTRERDGITKTIEGKYVFKKIGTQKFLEITYAADSDLIGNCYSTPIE